MKVKKINNFNTFYKEFVGTIAQKYIICIPSNKSVAIKNIAEIIKFSLSSPDYFSGKRDSLVSCSYTNYNDYRFDKNEMLELFNDYNSNYNLYKVVETSEKKS